MLFPLFPRAEDAPDVLVWAAPSVTDKSADTLFNPTPESQVRALCTDRPTKSNFPCTVDAGYFQYEVDAST